MKIKTKTTVSVSDQKCYFKRKGCSLDIGLYSFLNCIAKNLYKNPACNHCVVTTCSYPCSPPNTLSIKILLTYCICVNLMKIQGLQYSLKNDVMTSRKKSVYLKHLATLRKSVFFCKSQYATECQEKKNNEHNYLLR